MTKTFTSGVKNLATTAQEQPLNTGMIVGMDKDNAFTFTNATNGKKCKIVITCEDVKKLIEQMRTTINKNSSPLDHLIDSLNKYISSATTKIDAKNYQTFIKDIKDQGAAIDKLKKQKDIAFKTNYQPTPEIKVHVHVKGEKNHDSMGKIKSYNLARKSITVTYPNAVGKQETLEDIDINKLCISGQECVLPAQTGGAMSNDNDDNSSEKNYKIICE